MAKSNSITISPETLIWARESAGMSVDVAAEKMAIAKSKVEGWEAGDLKPTISQLRKAAKQYERPLATLFRSRPIVNEADIKDFRANEVLDNGMSSRLRSEIRRALYQRSVLIDLSEESTSDKVSKVPTSQTKDSVSVVASNLSTWIGYEIQSIVVKKRSAHDALRHVIELFENMEILVIQVTKVSVAEMRGFSIYNETFPVVAVNRKDSPFGRIFSMLHELAHLSLRQGGLCDLDMSVEPKVASNAVEKFCDKVAAEILMPDELFKEFVAKNFSRKIFDWSLEDLSKISRAFSVSSESALVRLVDLDITSWDTYRILKMELEEKYKSVRAKEQTGGPDPYVQRTNELGRSYILAVIEAFDQGNISSLDVSDYLNTSFDKIPKLVEKAYQ